MDIQKLRYYSLRGMICFGFLWYMLWLNSPNPPHIPPPNDGIYAPELNPNPKYFLTVNGFIDPKLEGKVPLRIISTFRTTNPECEYVYNWLEGVNSYRITEIDAPIPPDAKGNFTYRLPLDYYKPGFCKWEIQEVGYIDYTHPFENSRNEAKTSIASFRDTKYVFIQDIGYNFLLCSIDKKCKSDKYDYYALGFLAANQNYKFTIRMRKN